MEAKPARSRSSRPLSLRELDTTATYELVRDSAIRRERGPSQRVRRFRGSTWSDLIVYRDCGRVGSSR